MNFFAPGSAAERYAKGRPYFHPLVIRRVGELLSAEDLLPRALDVCCGTGQSAVALKELAGSVAGADASAGMLAHAPKDSGVGFFGARAESLPFADRAFDLLSVCQAFHWLDREAFMREARRVLRPGGWLVVYDNYFKAEMRENTDFNGWYRESYLPKYPTPPRVLPSFTREDAGRAGFDIVAEEWLPNERIFSAVGVVDFLLTHTNLIAAIEGGRESAQDARAWLASGVGPLFAGAPEGTFLFDAPLWLLRRRP